MIRSIDKLLALAADGTLTRHDLAPNANGYAYTEFRDRDGDLVDMRLTEQLPQTASEKEAA